MPESNKLNERQLSILAELNRRYDEGEPLNERQVSILAQLNKMAAAATPQPSVMEAIKTRLGEGIGSPTLFGLPIGGSAKGVADVGRAALNLLRFVSSDLPGALAPDRPGRPESFAAALMRGRTFGETLEPETREAIGQGLARAGGSIAPIDPEIARQSGKTSADILADPLLIGPGVLKLLRQTGRLSEVLNLLKSGKTAEAEKIIKALPPPRIPAEGVPVSRIRAAGELPPGARFVAGEEVTKNFPTEKALERLARLERDVEKARESRQFLQTTPPELPPPTRFEVLPSGEVLTTEQANLARREARAALPPGEGKAPITRPGFIGREARQEVTFRGLQPLPGSKDAVILVDLPGGSTVEFNEARHFLPRQELEKIRRAAENADLENIITEPTALERLGVTPPPSPPRGAEEIGAPLLSPRQIAAARKNIQSASGTTAPPRQTPLEELSRKTAATTEGTQTFRQFVESKGIPWNKVSGKNRDKNLYQKLFEEYTQKPEPAPTVTRLSGKEFAKGLIEAGKKDLSGEGLGVIADPYRHTRDFISKNSLQLSDDEIAALSNFTRKVARTEGITADDQVRLINDYIDKNIKLPSTPPGGSSPGTPSGQGGFPIPPRESFGESRFTEYTDAARQVIRENALRNEEGIKTARRGVITNEQLVGMANKKIREVEENIFKGKFKPYASEEENLAARMLLADEIKSFLDGVIEDIDPKKVEAVFGGKAFSGRLLQSQKIPLFDVKHIEKARQKLQELPEGPLRDAFSEAIKAVGLSKGEINPSALDKFVEWATMIKLTGLSTQVRNIIGNSAMLLFRPVEKAFVGPIDAARAALTGTSRSTFSKEALAEMIGMSKALKNAIHRGISVLHDPTKYFEEITKAGEVMLRAGAIGRGGRIGTALDQLIRPVSRQVIGALPENISRKVFPAGEFGFNFGEMVRLPGRFLSAMDVFFKELNTGAEIYALATRKALKEGLKDEQLVNRIAHYIQNPTDDMLEMAQKASKERVFQEDLSGITAALDKIRLKHPMARLLIPFYKTPVNILKQSVQRTPLSVALPSTWKTIYGTNPAAKVELVSRAFSGSLVLSALGMYAMEGKISGRGTDSKARRNMMRLSGWQPYSIKVGDQWLSYSGFEPISSWLRTAADIAEGTRSGTSAESIAAAATTSYIKQFAENPFLLGIRDIVRAFDEPNNRIPRFIAGLVTGSTIPNILQQWGTRVWDPVVREPRNLWQQIQARIPFGASTGVPAMRNIFGDEIVRENPVLQNLGLTISYEKSSKMGRELARLSQQDPGLVIGKPSRIVNGVELTEDEYDRFLILKGALFKKQLETLMNYPDYDKLSDDVKIQIIKRISRQLNDFTRRSEFAKYYTNRNIQ